MDFKFIPAKFYYKGWRRTPELIVIHWTAGHFKGAINTFVQGLSKASAHFVISVAGEIVQMVSLDCRAWHAGISSSKLGDGANGYSFGIELEGPPSMVGEKEWNREQLEACLEVIEYIKKEYPSVQYITDHSTISPGRKIDVKKGTGSDRFPWLDFVIKTNLKEL